MIKMCIGMVLCVGCCQLKMFRDSIIVSHIHSYLESMVGSLLTLTSSLETIMSQKKGIKKVSVQLGGVFQLSCVQAVFWC